MTPTCGDEVGHGGSAQIDCDVPYRSAQFLPQRKPMQIEGALRHNDHALKTRRCGKHRRRQRTARNGEARVGITLNQLMQKAGG